MSKEEGRKEGGGKEGDAIEGESLTMIINKRDLTLLNEFAQKNTPLESCAILIGKRKHNQFSVLEVVQMENDYKSEIKFTINEEKLFAVYKKAESTNLSVVGIYHTHPSNPTTPSKTDIKYMEINPVPWIINSTLTIETKCYIYNENDGDVMEIELTVMD
ncbi:MAG: M67 family metallopeptidase [Candidatus Nitrosocosmicus sp.]